MGKIFSIGNYFVYIKYCIFAVKNKIKMEPICSIKDIYKVLYQFEKAFSEENDITINEAMVLCSLKEGGSKTAGAICEYIGLSNSRVSKVITSVENKSYIQRLMNPVDKRQMLFVLTDEGREKIRQMQNKELGFEELFKSLSDCIKKG